MSRGGFIVFAKAPRVGLVKTRLSPPLSFDQCAEFYEAMLADVLDTTARLAAQFDLEPTLAFYPPDAAQEMLHRAPPDFRLCVQKGEGLGKRMANAFAEGAAAGAPFVLLRGSDSPALGASHVSAMLDRLEAGDDVVFTPDEGGGYAMIGMQTPHPDVFEVPMSTADMLAHSVQLGERLGLRVSLTHTTFDVDTARDFTALDALSAAESSDACPKTVEYVAHLRSMGVL